VGVDFSNLLLHVGAWGGGGPNTSSHKGAKGLGPKWQESYCEN